MEGMPRHGSRAHWQGRNAEAIVPRTVGPMLVIGWMKLCFSELRVTSFGQKRTSVSRTRFCALHPKERPLSVKQ